MQKKTRLSRSCKRSPTVSRDLTPTGIPLRVLACPVVRLQPKVMSFLSLLRDRFRPAHRRSAALRPSRVRTLFGSAKQMRGRCANDISTHETARGLHAPFVVLPREYELSDSARGLSMNRLLLILVVAATTGNLLFSRPTAAQVLPPAERAKSVQITQGPELESAKDDSAIIRWTSNNPGGTDDHFGVVHYGTDPKNLSEPAKSPIRLNRGHSDTIVRVSVDGH